MSTLFRLELCLNTVVGEGEHFEQSPPGPLDAFPSRRAGRCEQRPSETKRNVCRFFDMTILLCPARRPGLSAMSRRGDSFSCE